MPKPRTKQMSEEQRQKDLEKKRRFLEANPEYFKNWRATNKEYLTIQKRKWQNAHPECGQRWRKMNWERHKATKRAWLMANRERTRETTNAWAKAHPEFIRANYLRRQAILRGCMTFRSKLIAPMMMALGSHCIYCKAVLTKEKRGTSMDHMIPYSAGGRHTPTNIVPACFSCNSSKGKKDIREWLRWRHIPGALVRLKNYFADRYLWLDKNRRAALCN